MSCCGDCVFIFEEENRCVSENGIYKVGKCKPKNDASKCPAFLDKNNIRNRDTMRRVRRYINIGE